MTIMLSVIIVILLITLTYFILKTRTQFNNYSRLLSQKKSGEVVLGQIAEQLAPFTKNFKYEPHKVKFLGQPVDYIYFGEDKIAIIEVKSGNSKLTPKQANIKRLVQQGKVVWDEYRIPEKIKPTTPNSIGVKDGASKQ